MRVHFVVLTEPAGYRAGSWRTRHPATYPSAASKVWTRTASASASANASVFALSLTHDPHDPHHPHLLTPAYLYFRPCCSPPCRFPPLSPLLFVLFAPSLLPCKHGHGFEYLHVTEDRFGSVPRYCHAQVPASNQRQCSRKLGVRRRVRAAS